MVDEIPDLTLAQVTSTIYPLDDDVMAVIFPKGDTPPHFRHRCRAKREHAPGGIHERISAPSLSKHTVVSREPLTIVASVLCVDCGMHGFVTDGEWRAC
jgi:hypothetical protein